jgi:hypothetical protein
LSPNSENIRLNEEKNRSKRRRDEKKRQKDNDQTRPEPIYIFIGNDFKNIYELTVIQIKNYLREKKANYTGNKDELIEKIKTVN